MTVNELFENYDFEEASICDLDCSVIYDDGYKYIERILLSKMIKRFGNKTVISWNVTPSLTTKISLELE